MWLNKNSSKKGGPCNSLPVVSLIQPSALGPKNLDLAYFQFDCRVINVIVQALSVAMINSGNGSEVKRWLSKQYL